MAAVLLSHLPLEGRLRFLQRLDDAAAGRAVAWVPVEGVGVAPAVPTLGDRRTSGHSTVGRAVFDGPALCVEAIGRCWSRGRLLSWLTDSQELPTGSAVAAVNDPVPVTGCSPAGQGPAVGQGAAAQERHEGAAVGAHDVPAAPAPVGVGSLETDAGQVGAEPRAVGGGELVEDGDHGLPRRHRRPVERDRDVEGVDDGVAERAGRALPDGRALTRG